MRSRSNRLRLRVIASPSVLCSPSSAPSTQAPAGPSIDDLINLKRVGSPAISPDGQQVAYTVRETNWDENAYETEIWIGDAATGQARQLTNARKSSSQPALSPDGAWLGFISDRDGKRQLYRIALAGGEAEKLTSRRRRRHSFAWSPDGKPIAFTMIDPLSRGDQGAREALGRDPASRIRTSASRTSRRRPRAPRPVAAADQGQLRGRQLRLVARRHADRLRSSRQRATRPTAAPPTSRSSTSPRGESRVARRRRTGPDRNPQWSPDGTRRSRSSRRWRKPFYFFENSVIAAIAPAIGARSAALTDALRRRSRPGRVDRAGISLLGVAAHLVVPLHARSRRRKQIARHAVRDDGSAAVFSLTPDGAHRRVRRHERRASSPTCIVAPVQHDGGDEAERYSARRSRRGRSTRARWCKLEEPGRRRDRRRAAQAGRLPGRAGAIRCWS